MSSKKILDGKIAMMMMMKKIMTKKQNKKKKKMKLEIMESIMMQNKILMNWDIIEMKIYEDCDF